MIQAEFRPVRTALPALKRAFDQKMQQAAHRATDRAATRLKDQIRSEMSAAGLGRLGMALGSGSDYRKGGRVHRTGEGWSVSGWVFVRSGSKRSRGAIEAYTQGATILPRNPSGLLWIPTDDIMRMARIGKASYRLTPKLWRQTYEAKYGPLVRVRSGGQNLLIVRDTTLSLAGKPRSIKPLTKRGKVPKGQIYQKFVVAFIGIPQTTRSARVNPAQIARQVAAGFSRDFVLTTSTGAP